MTVRLARKSEVREFFRRTADERGIKRVRVEGALTAFALVDDGVITGVGGILWDRRDGRAWAFVDIPDKGLRPLPISLHRMARRMIGAAFASGETVIYAHRDPSKPNAARWLALLGFSIEQKCGDTELWACRALKR